MSNPDPTPPPVSGRWKPGQSGNPSGRPKKKPLTEALQRVLAKLSDDERDVLCQEIITKVATGDVAAFKEVADRVEGRVPQAITGDDQEDPIRIETIRRIIVRPGHTDSGSISTAATT